MRGLCCVARGTMFKFRDDGIAFARSAQLALRALEKLEANQI